ncbi:MAG TPA: hypothetical protein VIJ41_16285 [Candidatus Nanopelagicales bacterium]
MSGGQSLGHGHPAQAEERDGRSIWIALLCLVVLGVLLSPTTFGRYLYAAGGNAEAARLAGVRINRVRIAAFMASGAAAAIGGVIDVSRVLSAQSTSGDGLTFTVLAGRVVGGTSILGGEGAVWRTSIGVLFIALVGNGSDLLGGGPALPAGHARGHPAARRRSRCALPRPSVGGTGRARGPTA